MSERPDFYEIVKQVIDENHMRFEGDSGVESLNRLARKLGYEDTGFRYGTCLERMLSDNPGMQQAMVEWLMEQDSPEWRDNLVASLCGEEQIWDL